MTKFSDNPIPKKNQRVGLILLSVSLYAGAAIFVRLAAGPALYSTEGMFGAVLLCSLIAFGIGILPRQDFLSIIMWSLAGGIAGSLLLPSTSSTMEQRQLAAELQTIWDVRSTYTCLCACIGTIIGLNIDVIRHPLNSWNRQSSEPKGDQPGDSGISG